MLILSIHHANNISSLSTLLVCEVNLSHLLSSLDEVELVLCDTMQQSKSLIWVSSSQSQVGIGNGDPERDGRMEEG